MYVFTSVHCPDWLSIPSPYIKVKSIYKTRKTRVSIALVAMTHGGSPCNIIVKRYKKDHAKMKDFVKEVELHAALDHPNIVKLYGAWETASHYCLAIQHAAGGDLFDMLYAQHISMPYDVIIDTVLLPLLAALVYLHTRDIAHMDIKPENMGFDAHGKLLLMDFGLATPCSGAVRPTCHAFTKGYGAPELVHKNEYVLPKAIDMWCVGLLVFEVHEKKSPDKWHAMRRANGKRLTKLIGMCTREDPERRPTVDELLSHIANSQQSSCVS